MDKTDKKFRVGVIRSEFHQDLVEKLYEGARQKLLERFVEIAVTLRVPGAGEIPYAARQLISTRRLDGLLACGVIIRGETAHFDSLCRLLERGLSGLQESFPFPVVFSVLMVENRLQAEERLGGAKGHQGAKSAQALIELLSLREKINEME